MKHKAKLTVFLNGFKHAFAGIKAFLMFERNAIIHAACAIFVIIAGFIFTISKYDWLAIIFCIALVIITEMINTSVEKLADMIHKEQHPYIKLVKDIAAGAVLLASITAVITAAIIFFPKIFN